MYIPASLNGGFGYTKAATDFGTVIIPSVAGEPVDLLSNDLASKDGIISTVNGRTLFVGNLALRQSPAVYFSLDENKPNDEIANYVSLVALSMALPFDTDIQVVNALPVDYYFNQKKDAESNLIGEHKVIINGQERNFGIMRIRTTVQGLDLIFDQLLDDDGNIAVPWAAHYIAGLDFGFYTTNLIVINALEPVRKLCATIPIGVSSAWKLLVDYLYKNLNYTVHIEEVDELIKNPVINVRGQDWDISEAIAKAIKTTGEAINGKVKSRWPQRPFSRIFAGGGGVNHFEEFVLPGELSVVENSQTSGVSGGLKLARRESTWKIAG